MLRRGANCVPRVSLSSEADGGTLLKALLHCELLRVRFPIAADDREAIGLSAREKAALAESLAAATREWPRFASALRSAGWEEAALPLTGVAATRVDFGRS